MMTTLSVQVRDNNYCFLPFFFKYITYHDDLLLLLIIIVIVDININCLYLFFIYLFIYSNKILNSRINYEDLHHSTRLVSDRLKQQ